MCGKGSGQQGSIVDCGVCLKFDRTTDARAKSCQHAHYHTCHAMHLASQHASDLVWASRRSPQVEKRSLTDAERMIQPKYVLPCLYCGLTVCTFSASVLSITYLSRNTTRDFGETAEWDFDKGLLVFTTSSNTVARLAYIMSVKIRNGFAPQLSPELTVSSGPTLVIFANQHTITPAVGNQAPLKIAGFLRARMWQTNASAGGRNMLNVLLATNVDVPAVARCLPSSHQHLQCMHPRCLLTPCLSLCAK